MSYIAQMLEIIEDPKFTAWLASLRDSQAKARIAGRIQRLALGLAGDVESVGEGVSELRIHQGPSSSFCSVVATSRLNPAISRPPKPWRTSGKANAHDHVPQVRSGQLSR